jgi:hypothetical protein
MDELSTYTRCLWLYLESPSVSDPTNPSLISQCDFAVGFNLNMNNPFPTVPHKNWKNRNQHYFLAMQHIAK